MQTLVLRVLLTWILFIPIAIANGIIRESTYKLVVGDLAAHQISTITASIAFIALSYVMLKDLAENLELKTLFCIGIVWVIMTILFEFGFGHYVDKAPWEKLFADYNIFRGRVWGLFLLVIFVTPYCVKLLRSPGK